MAWKHRVTNYNWQFVGAWLLSHVKSNQIVNKLFVLHINNDESVICVTMLTLHEHIIDRLHWINMLILLLSLGYTTLYNGSWPNFDAWLFLLIRKVCLHHTLWVSVGSNQLDALCSRVQSRRLKRKAVMKWLSYQQCIGTTFYPGAENLHSLTPFPLGERHPVRPVRL